MFKWLLKGFLNRGYMYLHDYHSDLFGHDGKFGQGTGAIGVAYEFTTEFFLACFWIKPDLLRLYCTECHTMSNFNRKRLYKHTKLICYKCSNVMRESK